VKRSGKLPKKVVKVFWSPPFLSEFLNTPLNTEHSPRHIQTIKVTGEGKSINIHSFCGDNIGEILFWWMQ
jgi:hypothetical protein